MGLFSMLYFLDFERILTDCLLFLCLFSMFKITIKWVGYHVHLIEIVIIPGKGRVRIQNERMIVNVGINLLVIRNVLENGDFF